MLIAPKGRNIKTMGIAHRELMTYKKALKGRNNLIDNLIWDNH